MEDSQKLAVLSGVFRQLTDCRQDRLLKTAEGLLSVQRTAKGETAVDGYKGADRRLGR